VPLRDISFLSGVPQRKIISLIKSYPGRLVTCTY